MFAALDWQSRDFYVYLAIGGGVAAVLGLVLYALPGGRLRLPGGVVGVGGGLALGVALGVLLMFAFHYQLENPLGDQGPSASGPPAVPRPLPGRGPAGGPGPQTKPQLVQLVAKLDMLTEKPLALRLSDEQRKEIKAQLKGLADAEELSDDDAKSKVEELHKVLKDQQPVLEAAGYNMSGPGGGRGGRGGGGRGPAGSEDNPFKAESNAKHLKSLSDRLKG